MRPLYVSAQQVKRGVHGHAGLWFDKFCDQWSHDPWSHDWSMTVVSDSVPKAKPRNPKVDWLKTLTEGAVGEAGQLREAKLRLARLVRAAGGRLAVFRSESRFVTGLGRAHPVENGFAFHPSLGTPYLPGSSVKGLVRSWVRASDGVDKSAESAAVDRLLGKGGNDGAAGALCFLDAIPIARVSLEIDVLTPHAAGWTEDDPPGDWRSPTPVPFLVTAPGASFLFAVVPAPGRSAGARASEADLDHVFFCLQEALAWEGAGAKTAVGYGRFEGVESETAKIHLALDHDAAERARAEVMRTPRGRMRLRVEESDEKALQDRIREFLGQDQCSVVERAAFVAAVRAMRADWLAKWREGKFADGSRAKRQRRDKLIELARIVDSEPSRDHVTSRDTQA